MEKKKVIKIILLVITILAIIIIGLTVRKIIIIKELDSKIPKYINSNNYYVKVTNNDKTILEYYCKGKKSLMFYKIEGETSEICKFYDGEEERTYVINSGEAKAFRKEKIDTVAKIHVSTLTSGNNNLAEMLNVSFMHTIKDAKLNGKNCYLVNGVIYKNTYIDKETGLIMKADSGFLKSKDGAKKQIINTYTYEFNNVTDEDLKEPEITEDMKEFK